jgi:hypothetical protein
VSRLSRQCGIFNIVQPYRPPRSVTGIALLFFYIPLLTHSNYLSYPPHPPGPNSSSNSCQRVQITKLLMQLSLPSRHVSLRKHNSVSLKQTFAIILHKNNVQLSCQIFRTEMNKSKLRSHLTNTMKAECYASTPHKHNKSRVLRLHTSQTQRKQSATPPHLTNTMKAECYTSTPHKHNESRVLRLPSHSRTQDKI